MNSQGRRGRRNLPREGKGQYMRDRETKGEKPAASSRFAALTLADAFPDKVHREADTSKLVQKSKKEAGGQAKGKGVAEEKKMTVPEKTQKGEKPGIKSKETKKQEKTFVSKGQESKDGEEVKGKSRKALGSRMGQENKGNELLGQIGVNKDGPQENTQMEIEGINQGPTSRMEKDPGTKKGGQDNNGSPTPEAQTNEDMVLDEAVRPDLGLRNQPLRDTNMEEDSGMEERNGQPMETLQGKDSTAQ